MTDKAFKSGVLIMGVLFLILFYQFTQNNRFQMNGSSIFDTRTGIIYEPRDNTRWIKADPRSGEIKVIPLKWKDDK